MIAMEPWQMGLSALVESYRRRDFKPSEVVTVLLDRIERLDSDIGAFRTVLAEGASVEAMASDRRINNSPRPLEGVPVAIKELFDVAGTDGAYGSTVLAGRVPTSDAAAVRRLREAGAIVIGTTRSHEFGWGITTQHQTLGSTSNPWALDRVPGGSSGGSAAALAVGMVPLALGSDTGGSIRIPAALCGVVGLKPTYGRISKHGAVALAPTLDHPGPLARSVEDVSVALEVLQGFDPDDTSTIRTPMAPPLTRPRVAVCHDLWELEPPPDHRSLFDAAVERLKGDGFDVVEVPFPLAAAIRPTFGIIQMAEAYHVHAVTLGTYPKRADDYGPDVRNRIEMASEVTISDYLEARATARAISAAFDHVFDTACDVIVSPVSGGPPSSRLEPDRGLVNGKAVPFRDLVMGFTVPQDLAGLPAVAVPAGLDNNGLPVGIQVTAGRNHEATAAMVASVIAVDLGWPPSATGRGTQ